MPKKEGSYVLRFPAVGSADPDAKDIAEFIMLFRGAYVAASQLGGKRQAASAEKLRQFIERLSAEELAELFDDGSKSKALLVRRVSHQSPIEIELIGSLNWLVWAVILLGGTVSIGIAKFELPKGLLETIAKLTRLFSKRAKTHVAYGPRDRVIKLTKEQLAELMKHDPSKRTRGGFQRFLISLQFRVNRTTRELTLSPADIDIILQYGSQPHKGGWQRSIRRIFDTHFDWL